MLDKGDRLWRRIGVNSDRADTQEQGVSRTSSYSASSGARWPEGDKHRQETTPATVSLLEQPPFAPPSMPLRHGWQEDAQLLITQEESRFEQVGRGGPEAWQQSLQLDELEESIQDPSGLPESVTPLVYSKNSRKGEVRFSKQTAKAIILKIRLAETKDLLRRVRADMVEFAGRVREQQEGLQQEVCAKWFQLQREQSLRVQESVFMHQQDCQQLRYELEVLRGKEDLMQCPVDSELVLAAPAHLRQENDDLRGQLARLAEENGRLAREGEGFKRKMGEIEAKTAEVRQSNDKLYEYIFDLEQKVAYYQEEIPKISQRAREESQQLLQRELEEATAAHYEEMTRSVEQLEQVQAEAARLRSDLKKSNELVVQLEKENAEVRVRLERQEEELKARQQESEARGRENTAMQAECRRLKSELQRMGKEREEMQQWREEQRRESSSRLSRAYSIKEDKKLIEALEIEKLVLQKENIQLKATIEFYSKSQNYAPATTQNYAPNGNQSYTSPNFILQKAYSMPYDSPQNHQQIDQKDKELEMKERELISLQNYLEDEARRLDSKQRDIESEYIIKKTERREYVQPTRITTIDDYGMKKLPITQPKHLPQPRRNHFCSSETQAIIQKVKMRQKMRENGCICNNETRNCHCDAHSRGSRTSQDSNSRDYLRMQHHRPSNYSPHDYLKREQKSSKMKLIEDKVRRLKSQLKSSFTTMGS